MSAFLSSPRFSFWLPCPVAGVCLSGNGEESPLLCLRIAILDARFADIFSKWSRSSVSDPLFGSNHRLDRFLCLGSGSVTFFFVLRRFTSCEVGGAVSLPPLIS